jgi:hypothetical protein
MQLTHPGARCLLPESYAARFGFLTIVGEGARESRA